MMDFKESGNNPASDDNKNPIPNFNQVGRGHLRRSVGPLGIRFDLLAVGIVPVLFVAGFLIFKFLF